MAKKDLFGKFASAYVWGNVVAVLIVIAFIAMGVRIGLDFYTRHGESIVVPNIVNMQYDDAEDKLDALGLDIAVNDTGYNEKLPPDCILEQSPDPGKRVKGGYIVYVTINAASPPTLVIPDVIENGSWREVRARMVSMGFKITEPEYIPGERDWIDGIKVNGRSVKAGDRVPIDAKIMVQVGDGTRIVTAADSAFLKDEEVEYGEREVDVPDYVYEEVEVQVDAAGNEIDHSSHSDVPNP